MSRLALTGVDVVLGGRRVVRGVDAAIGAGELVVIVGPNGAGKSTLLRVLAGLLPPAAGTVRCFDRDPHTAPREAIARELAYLPQRYESAFPFAVEEVVLMGRYARQRGLGLASADDLAAADAAMAACEVGALAQRRFDQLSGGEARRVIVAQALCQGARALLLDEPTAGLDPVHARRIFALLRAQCERELTAVIVTDDLDLALRYGHTMWLVADGELAARGTPAEVLAAAATRAAFELDIHLGTLPSGQAFAVPA